MQWKLLSITHNFKIKRFSRHSVIGLSLLISIILISYQGFLAHKHKEELQVAFENSGEILAEARINSDTSRLSEVFTQAIIPQILEGLETAKNPTALPITSIKTGSIIELRFFVILLISSSKNSANFIRTSVVPPVSSPTSTICEIIAG